MTKKKKPVRKQQTKRKTKAEEAADSELKEWIGIVIIGAITVVAYMQMGVVGVYLSRFCRFLFGKFYYVILAAIVIQILITMINRRDGNTAVFDIKDLILNQFPICLKLIIIIGRPSTKTHGLNGLSVQSMKQYEI